jgi:hypothetical protein
MPGNKNDENGDGLARTSLNRKEKRPVVPVQTLAQPPVKKDNSCGKFHYFLIIISVATLVGIITGLKLIFECHDADKSN